MTQQALMAVQKNVSAMQGDPSEISPIKVKQQALEAQQRTLKKAREDFYRKMAGLPPKGLKLARLQREVQIQNAMYLVLVQQYESALLDEAKDTDMFLLLDSAVPANRPISPKKRLNSLIGFLLGALAGSFWVLFREGRESVLSNKWVVRSETALHTDVGHS
jgi:tyrosine-protein kinase Etk/Wzc